MFINANGQVAQYIFIDAHAPLVFGDGRGRRIDIEEHVVALAVFLDAEG